VNRDPIGYRGGMNLFEYVNGMPLDGLDPNGLEREMIRDGFHAYIRWHSSSQ